MRYDTNALTLIIATIVFNLLILGLLFWLSRPGLEYVPSNTTENITTPQKAGDLTLEKKWKDEWYGNLRDYKCNYSWDLEESWQKEPGLISGHRIEMEALRRSEIPYDKIKQQVEIYENEEMAKEAYSDWSSLNRKANLPDSSKFYPLNLSQIGDESKAWTISYEEPANVYAAVFRRGRVVEGISVNMQSFSKLDKVHWFYNKTTKKELFLQLVQEAEGYVTNAVIVDNIQMAFETIGMKLRNSISNMGWFYAACFGLTAFLFGYGLGNGESIREGWHRPNVKKPWPKSYDNWGEPIYDAEKMHEYEYSKRPNKWMPFFITSILMGILLLRLLLYIFWK